MKAFVISSIEGRKAAVPDSAVVQVQYDLPFDEAFALAMNLLAGCDAHVRQRTIDGSLNVEQTRIRLSTVAVLTEQEG